MSRFNPSTPLHFSHELWQGQTRVVAATWTQEGAIESDTVGYFTQGDDGQWWWFAYDDDGDQAICPLSASNLMQIIAQCHELNANGWRGVE